MRERCDGKLVLTEAEIANGWTEADVLAYQAERDKAMGLVPGNVVTPFVRPRPAMRIENCQGYDPCWRYRRR